MPFNAGHYWFHFKILLALLLEILSRVDITSAQAHWVGSNRSTELCHYRILAIMRHLKLTCVTMCIGNRAFCNLRDPILIVLPAWFSGPDPLLIDFVLDKRLWISWFPWLRFCGRCRNLEFTITIKCSKHGCHILHLNWSAVMEHKKCWLNRGMWKSVQDWCARQCANR